MTEIFFDDLTPGRVFDLGTTVVDHDEMVEFARRFDPQPFHLDEAAAKESIFGAVAASGWFTASLWMRAYVDVVLSRAASVASPGGDQISWPAPVFAGDELAMTLEIGDARRSRSRPEIGLVTVLAHTTRGDETVYRARFTGMFGVRP